MADEPTAGGNPALATLEAQLAAERVELDNGKARINRTEQRHTDGRPFCLPNGAPANLRPSSSGISSRAGRQWTCSLRSRAWRSRAS